MWCDYHWFTDVAAAWALSALLIQLTFWIYRARTPPLVARPSRQGIGRASDAADAPLVRTCQRTL